MPTTSDFKKSVLNVRGVFKSYVMGGSRHNVLDDVSLDIKSGEMAILLGPSGSGKTTLLDLVAGLSTPDQGTINVDGNELHIMNDVERTLYRRKKVGVVFQFFNLLPTLTVEENVLLPLHLSGVMELRTQTLNRLALLGLDHLRARFPEELSGGEQQRVAIVRALANNPKLIIADEPTGNLDHTTGEKVVNLFVKQVRESGVALLMATHNRALSAVADRVFQMEDAKLVELKGFIS